MQAIILAAGFGTRLRPYTLIKPKPLFPIVNRPLLYILLDKLKAAGFGKIVVNCHHLAEQIIEALALYPEVHIQYEAEILGTGGSVRKALPFFTEEPILIMNGDIYHSIDLKTVYEAHLHSDAAVTMAMHNYERFNNVGVIDGKIRSFTPDFNDTKKAFTGVHIIEPETAEMIPETGFFHIIDLYRQLAKQGRIDSYAVDGCFWRDIGTPKDYLLLHEELLASLKDSRLWNIDRDVVLHPDVKLEGWGVIGSKSVVHSGAYLCRSVVWEETEIEANAMIKDTIVTGKKETGEGADEK